MAETNLKTPLARLSPGIFEAEGLFCRAFNVKSCVVGILLCKFLNIQAEPSVAVM
jgi:hypothetical protein